MRLDRFQLERAQSMYENEVAYNLSESGVQPLAVQDLLNADSARSAFLGLGLKYAQSKGSAELRSNIASFYDGAAEDNVLVSTGTSEANHTALCGLLEERRRAAIMIPNYLQSWGLARAYADRADPYRLVEADDNGRRRWALDVESLHRAVSKNTQLIMVTNPNNPTGAVLTEPEMDEIVRVARKVRAWIVVDEVYRGTEVRGKWLTPSFWGRYPKVVVTAGLSKAFGLPGLRVGWVLGPKRVVERLWTYQDYTTLTPGLLSDRLATAAMEPARREQILARTRSIIAQNLPRVESWIATHADIFDYIPPVAGAMAFIKYRLPISSTRLSERLRREQSVLVPAGSYFGVGKYFRIGTGYSIEGTLAGLSRFDLLLHDLQHGRAKKSPRRSRLVASA